MRNFEHDLCAVLALGLRERKKEREKGEKEKDHLKAMELINGEILDRNLEHDLAAVLGLGLHTQSELVVDHRHQVRGHLRYR